MKHKKCSKCGRFLPATTEFFGRNPKGRNGLDARCKDCEKVHQKAYWHDYYEAHKTQLLVARRAWSEDHAEEMNAADRAYRAAHKKEKAATARAYYEAHLSAGMMTWQQVQAHRERYNEYCRLRRQASPKLRIAQSIYRGIGGGLSGRQILHTWEAQVGYTLDDLKRHLESLFQPGMAFANYGRGGWELDHVKPLSMFDYSSVNDPQFKECWALSNLQPLWVTDNRRKYTTWQEQAV